MKAISANWARALISGSMVALVFLVLVAGAAGSGAVAELAKGKIGSVRWGVWVVPAGKKLNPRPPCLGISLIVPTGRDPGFKDPGFNENEGDVCGVPRTDSPLAQSVSTGNGPRERTVLTLGFPLDVKRVELNLGPRGRVTLPVRIVSSEQARKADISPFAYIAKGFAGAFCLRRFLALDSEGMQVSDSGSMPCP